MDSDPIKIAAPKLVRGVPRHGMLLVFVRGKGMGARHAGAIVLPQSFDMSEMLAGEFEHLAQLHATVFPVTK